MCSFVAESNKRTSDNYEELEGTAFCAALLLDPLDIKRARYSVFAHFKQHFVFSSNQRSIKNIFIYVYVYIFKENLHQNLKLIFIFFYISKKCDTI